MNLTRRDFLKGSLGVSGLVTFGGLVPAFLSRTAQALGAASGGSHPLLVVIQLSGGNDGLNTVVPYEDDAYHRSRPTLRVLPNQVLKLDAGLGLHPDMTAFHRLYHEGLVSVVQGVGYPNSQRDHGPAMRDWHSGLPVTTAPQTGWLGRAIDGAYEAGRSDVPGVFTGQIKAPFSLQTERAVVPSMPTLDLCLGSSGSGPASGVELERLARPSRTAARNPLLEFVQAETIAACGWSHRLQTVVRSDGDRTDAYPDYPLARTLRSIALMIRAELGMRIYFAELGGGGIGGFDTHAGQATNHGALLRELAESVAAFVQDLRRNQLLDSVLVLTFSEFGRTLSENGRRGTGHGAAAPMFLAGGRLKGGLIGAHPSLSDLAEDAPKFHTDFRRVYATVLERWLGFDSRAILGEGFPLLEGVLG